MRRQTVIKTKSNSHKTSERTVVARITDNLESLLSELSSAMLSAPAHATDGEIGIWLGKTCEALNVDRAGVFERKERGGSMNMTHTWVRSPYPPDPPEVVADYVMKSIVRRVMAGESFKFSHPEELPSEMDDLKAWVTENGPKAGAAVPLRAGNDVFGMVTFGKFSESREWPPALLRRLNLVAEIFGNAIQRRRAEDQLQQVQSELRIASRRNMMSELVASLAHEINQPLGAIMSNLSGLSRLLSQGNPDLVTALTVVSNAIDDTKRAAETLRRVRFMFTRHTENKAPVDIGEVVSDVVKMLASESTIREIPVRTQISESLRQVLADRVQIQQCVMNLIINAFDAIGEAKSDRGNITIAVAPHKTGWVAISVHDTGTGIDPSVADRLFEPFVTSKSNGMGLGLLVTRSIIENHGGKIWATPNSDRGTTFTFTLPLVEKKEPISSQRKLDHSAARRMKPQDSGHADEFGE